MLTRRRSGCADELHVMRLLLEEANHSELTCDDAACQVAGR